MSDNTAHKHTATFVPSHHRIVPSSVRVRLLQWNKQVTSGVPPTGEPRCCKTTACYRITGGLGLEETSKDQLVQAPTIGRDTFH